MTLPAFTYGVEIELFLPAGTTHAQAADAITRRGIACNAESYNHTTRAAWKIVTDGSLGDYTRGAEIVSPVLSGEAGLEQLAAVLDAANDLGCTVSKACGIHVHVGVEGMGAQTVRNLLKIYAAHERIIDGFLPPSRRANDCRWARSLTALPFARIDAARTLADLVGLFGAGRQHEVTNHDARRYQKVNILPIAAFEHFGRGRPTVEFRQHSGSLEYPKISNWIALCLRMVDAARAGRTSVATRTRAPQTNRGRNGSKARLVGEMMLRPEGVTAAEAIAATGWPSISLPAQAAACGLTFTTQRTGRVVRYFALAGETATQAAAPTLDGFMTLVGATEAERTYFRTRTTRLSGPVAWAA